MVMQVIGGNMGRMTPENFIYWLQGYFELTDTDEGLSELQVKVIQDHIDLVMNKVTPNREQDAPFTPIEDPWYPPPQPFDPYYPPQYTHAPHKPIDYIVTC